MTESFFSLFGQRASSAGPHAPHESPLRAMSTIFRARVMPSSQDTGHANGADLWIPADVRRTGSAAQSSWPVIPKRVSKTQNSDDRASIRFGFVDIFKNTTE